MRLDYKNGILLLLPLRFCRRDRWQDELPNRVDGLDPIHHQGKYLTSAGLPRNSYWPIIRLLSRSWHMYPLGFIFGLGFETATEVALFGISATAAGKGLSISSMMVFPLLFTAGMTLVDTTDRILMVGASGWALVKPIRKLHYNMTITLISLSWRWLSPASRPSTCLEINWASLVVSGNLWEVRMSIWGPRLHYHCHLCRQLGGINAGLSVRRLSSTRIVEAATLRDRPARHRWPSSRP